MKTFDFTEFEYVDENHADAVFVVDPARGRNLDGVHIHRAWLNGRDLTETTFRGANLRGAVFHDSDLTGADLTGAILINTHFEDAVLRNAIPRDCLTIDTMMRGADLRGADLIGCHNPTNIPLRLLGSRYDAATRWPKGVDPDALGAIFCEAEA